MSGPDYSRAGANRDRVRTVVQAWPADATAAGIAMVSADDAAAQADLIGFDAADYALAEHTHDPTEVDGMSKTVLGSDQTNDDATPNTIADVTGLAFSAANGGTYLFRAVVPFTAAASTTGSRWSVNGPATTLLRYRVVIPTSPSAESVTHAAAYDEPASCTTDSPSSGLALIEGILTASADGTVAIRFASEVAGSAIVAKAGAVLRYQRVA